eukprot:631589-Pyramimonas_sp.AAC.1
MAVRRPNRPQRGVPRGPQEAKIVRLLKQNYSPLELSQRQRRPKMCEGEEDQWTDPTPECPS